MSDEERSPGWFDDETLDRIGDELDLEGSRPRLSEAQERDALAARTDEDQEELREEEERWLEEEEGDEMRQLGLEREQAMWSALQRDWRGLITQQGNPVPLERVSLGGEILGEHARLTVRQVYRNVESVPIEAIYVFPLPPEAALAGFRVAVDGRELHGELMARDTASEAYQEAVAAGHGAALFEMERPGVHTLSLGNVLPSSTVEAEVELLVRLEVREGETRLKIPTLVAPRYIPGVPQGGRTGDGVAPPTDRVPDADRITPPVGEAPYRLDLDLELLGPAATTVESPSHGVVVREVEGRRRVAFELPGEPLDRDLVLVVRGQSEKGTAREATAWVSARGGERTVAIALPCPVTSPAEERPVEPSAPNAILNSSLDIALVVDVSGSMAGASLEQAKRAARLCLRQLRRGDRVFLLEFDARLYPFSPEPVAWSPELLERADRWIEGHRGGGGTELGRALDAAVQALRDSPAAAVLVLTDGQVGQEEEIFRRLAAKKGAPRIASIGIGTNVVGTLLERLAKATGGAVEEIHPGERIEPKVVAQFARLAARAWRDVKPVALPEGLDRLAPAGPWTLVEGETTTLFARLDGALPKRLELEGRWGKETRRWTIELRPAPGGARPVLERFHAALRVREMEEKLAGIHARDLAPGTAAKRRKTLEQELEKLSIATGILSTATAWVAIEERAEIDRTDGLPATRVVPVAAPKGWAMFEEETAAYAGRCFSIAQSAAPLAPTLARAPSVGMPAMASLDPGRPRRRQRGAGSGSGNASVGRFEPTFGAQAADELAAQEVYELLARQGGDGLWGAPSAPDLERVVETLAVIERLLEAGALEPFARRALARAAEALLEIVERRPDRLARARRVEALALARRVAERLDPDERSELLERLAAARAEEGRLGAPSGT